MRNTVYVIRNKENYLRESVEGIGWVGLNYASTYCLEYARKLIIDKSLENATIVEVSINPTGYEIDMDSRYFPKHILFIFNDNSSYSADLYNDPFIRKNGQIKNSDVGFRESGIKKVVAFDKNWKIIPEFTLKSFEDAGR